MIKENENQLSGWLVGTQINVVGGYAHSVGLAKACRYSMKIPIFTRWNSSSRIQSMV